MRSFISLLARTSALVAALLALGMPVSAGAPDQPVSDDRAGRLERYYFHEGFYAGSLRSEVPLPVYDSDPEHLWNRLFAAFSIRNFKPSQWSPTGLPLLRVDEWMPEELSPRLKEVWWRTYNRERQGRIEGGDVVELPLLAHPDSFTTDSTYIPVAAVLDEFLKSHGERLIQEPVKRAMLVRDLWHAFDVLQRLEGWRHSRGNPFKPPANFDPEVMKERQRALSRKLAVVIQAVALSEDEISALPDTYVMAIKSGRFTAENDYDRNRPYLPAHLLDGLGEWAEIQNELKGILAHTDGRGFEGRAWFRVFYRFPESAGGRQALERFLSEPSQFHRDEFLQGPDVPPGTEVAFVRMMMTLDRERKIHATKVVEDLQIRVLKYVDGAEHPDTDSGRGQNFYQYELRRTALFEGSRDSGLRRVSNEEPRYFHFIVPFASLVLAVNDPERAGSLVALREDCTNCHKHANVPFHTHKNVDRSYPPGFPFGKASIRSFLRTPPLIVPPKESLDLANRVIAWKTSQPSYRRLVELMAQLR